MPEEWAKKIWTYVSLGALNISLTMVQVRRLRVKLDRYDCGLMLLDSHCSVSQQVLLQPLLLLLLLGYNKQGCNQSSIKDEVMSLFFPFLLLFSLLYFPLMQLGVLLSGELPQRVGGGGILATRRVLVHFELKRQFCCFIKGQKLR